MDYYLTKRIYATRRDERQAKRLRSPENLEQRQQRSQAIRCCNKTLFLRRGKSAKIFAKNSKGQDIENGELNSKAESRSASTVASSSDGAVTGA
eukprot:g74400.t1